MIMQFFKSLGLCDFIYDLNYNDNNAVKNGAKCKGKTKKYHGFLRSLNKEKYYIGDHGEIRRK